MLTTLSIDPGAPQDWAWDGTRYTAPGSGVIEPYAHPMTEHAAVTDGSRTAVILRDRTRHRPGLHPDPVRLTPRELDQVIALARQWPADHVLIETERHQPVRITAGAARTTPLYLAHSGGVLHGSWDMGRLRQFAADLNPKEVTRMLAYHPVTAARPPSPASGGLPNALSPPSAATCTSATRTPPSTPHRANWPTAATCSPPSPARSTPPLTCAPSTLRRRCST